MHREFYQVAKINDLVARSWHFALRSGFLSVYMFSFSMTGLRAAENLGVLPMSDYYQNYRSGNRPPRTYENGVYNPQDRQNPNFRRKNPNQRRSEGSEQLEALLRDLMPVLSKTLESITDHQRRLADEVENKVRTEERKVTALEVIAASLRKHLAGDMEIDQSAQPIMAIESEESAVIEPLVSSQEMSRENIVQIIHEMYDSGSTYNEIAQYLASKNIPTFSGRGNWHAQTIHRLYKEA